jgi:hypothetical protein
MKRTTARVLGLAMILAFPALSVANDVPELTATYAVSNVSKGMENTDMIFSFTLFNGGGGSVTVQKIVLADPATADSAFGKFDGGAIPAGGNLKRSASVTIPNKIADSWKTGGQPALFVYTKTDQGNVARTRIDAVRGAQ